MTITEAPNIELMAGTFYTEDPYRAFAWMRRHAPVYWDEAGEVWGITRYADVRAIGQDPQNFSSAQGSRPNTPLPYMIDLDAPEHRRRRRLVSAGFTPEAVKVRQPRVRQVCDEIIDTVCETGSCDLVSAIAAPPGHDRRHARISVGRLVEASRVVGHHADIAGIPGP
jgi:cytochrome P450 family 142 subfamily A polypeptide 1